MTIHMEVEEDESTRESPQIVGLDVEIGDPVFAAIGSQQISRYVCVRLKLNISIPHDTCCSQELFLPHSRYVDKVNLPALLLAIRTLIPLAQLRYRFFASIAMLYPNLARNHIEHLAARGITLTGQKRQGSAGPSVPSLATLIDPDTMGSLQLQSDRGATLDVLFAIEFNQWGHARPHLSVAPTISSLGAFCSGKQKHGSIEYSLSPLHSRRHQPIFPGKRARCSRDCHSASPTSAPTAHRMRTRVLPLLPLSTPFSRSSRSPSTSHLARYQSPLPF